MRADILTFLLLGTCRAALLLLVAIGVCASASAQPVIFSNPDQFLVDKEADFVAIVTVRHVENRWVVLPDGDHVPFVVSDGSLEEVLSGTAWQVGRTESMMQFDYNDLMFDPIAAPAIPDRRYVLWASQANAEIPSIAPWIRSRQTRSGVATRLHFRDSYPAWVVGRYPRHYWMVLPIRNRRFDGS